MEKVKLGEIALLINGDRGKNYPSQEDITDDGEVPFVNAGHLNGKNIDYSDMNYISQEKYEKLSSGKFEKGDILYCLRGSLGKKAIVNDEVRGAIASSLVIIRPDRKKVNGDYLMFSLDAPTIREQLTKANNGSTQPNLSASSVREFRIELPTLLVQKDVVEKLTKLQHVIEKRQNQINLLDKLVKARFVEMFGDPITNEKGWNVEELDSVCDAIGDGLHGTPEYDEDGKYPFINGNNLMNGVIEVTPSTKKVSEKTYKKYYIELTDNAILLSINGTLGKLAFYNGEEVMLGKSACYCNLKQKINREFVYGVMKTEAFTRFLERNATASTIKNVGLRAIRGFKLILPPEELQIKFVNFSRQIDKSKVVVPSKIKNTIFAIMLSVSFGQITSI